MTKFTRTAETTAEYKEAKKHAEALDFEIEEVSASGGWDTANGEPVFFEGGPVTIESVGRKYFHIELDVPEGSEVVKCEPSASMTGDGELKITFKE